MPDNDCQLRSIDEIPLKTDDGKGRVTVELVGAKVDEVKAIIAGHAETTTARLDAIKDRIGPLARLPECVGRIEERVRSLETSRRYRSIHFPAFLISLAAVAVAVAALISQHT